MIPRSFWLVWCDFFVGLRLVVAGCVLVWVVLLAFLLGLVLVGCVGLVISWEIFPGGLA